MQMVFLAMAMARPFVWRILSGPTRPRLPLCQRPCYVNRNTGHNVIRKFLFQLHLWSGLILGIVFVLIGVSGSILMVGRSLYDAPIVHVTAVTTPALDKGLAAARAAVGAPRNLD